MEYIDNFTSVYFYNHLPSYNCESSMQINVVLMIYHSLCGRLTSHTCSGRRKRAAATALEASRDMPQDLDEYDIGDLLSDLSSALSSDSLREDRSLEDSNYPVEDLSLAEVVKEGRKASRMKEGQLAASMREAPPAILYGMRDIPRHRFI